MLKDSARTEALIASRLYARDRHSNTQNQPSMADRGTPRRRSFYRFAVSYAVGGVSRSNLSRLVSGNPTGYKVSMPEIESAIIVTCMVTKPLQLSGYCAAGRGRPTVCTSN